MGITTHVVQYNFVNIAENAERAAREFGKQLAGRNPAQIIYFAAGNYDPAERKMRCTLPTGTGSKKRLQFSVGLVVSLCPL